MMLTNKDRCRADGPRAMRDGPQGCLDNRSSMRETDDQKWEMTKNDKRQRLHATQDEDEKQCGSPSFHFSMNQ